MEIRVWNCYRWAKILTICECLILIGGFNFWYFFCKYFCDSFCRIPNILNIDGYSDHDKYLYFRNREIGLKFLTGKKIIGKNAEKSCPTWQ